MLARSFLSATDLGISEQERDALIRTMFAFERGEIKPEEFDMREWCKTACCICGHAMRFNPSVFQQPSTEMPDGLYRLFIPGYRDLPTMRFMETIKPHEAAQALSNYLTTGLPRWREALDS